MKMGNPETLFARPAQPRAAPVQLTREQELEACLVELLRLYDWRNELGRREKAGDMEQLAKRNALLVYGREKKAAWLRVRALGLVGTP